MSKRRKFDKAFKEMALELLSTGKSATTVERELGIIGEDGESSGLVHRWKRERERYQGARFQGNGNRLLSA